MYLIKNIGINIKSKNIPESESVNLLRSIRRSVSRNKQTIDYSKTNIIDRICTKCKSKINNNEYYFIFIKEADNIYNMYFNGHPKDKEYGLWHLCVKCRKLKEVSSLNPNSIEYIKLAYNLSEKEASILLLERNKSPFYKANHKDEESYKKFQGHHDYSESETKNWKENQKESYYKNKESFINDYGIEQWNEKNKIKDSMSINFFKNKYSNDKIAKMEYEKRISSVIQTSPILHDKNNCLKWLSRKTINILTIEDFYNKLDNLFNTKNIISIKYLIDTCFIEIENNTSNNKHKYIWINYSIIVYDIKKDYLYNRYGINNQVSDACDKVNKIRNGNRSYNISEDGFYFRSGYEYTLYVKMKELGVEIIDVNKKYPNCIYFYDFYVIIDNNHRYIELCGDYSACEYRNTQYIKAALHNSILVGYNHINCFIRDLKNGTFNESNIYY